MLADFIACLGAKPEKYAYGEVYSLLERGEVDGAENNWPSYQAMQHYEVAKYYTIDEHTRVPELQVCARHTWEKLSEEDQEIIRQCAKESAVYQRKLWTQQEEKSKEIAIAEGSLPKKAEFMVKYCNIKQNSSLAWLDTKTIAKCCGEHLNIEDFKSSYCVAGIDLSRTTDLTAAVVVIERDGEFYVFAKFWLPKERIEEAIARDNVPYNLYIERGLLEPSGDNYVDYHDCYNWLVHLVEDLEILPLQTGYDRYSAQYLIQDLSNYGFHVDDVYQGTNLWGVLQEIEGLMKDGKVHIGDNDLLKMHLLNSAIKIETNSARGRLIKLNPTAHIDGMAALSDAMCVRQKWYNDIGEQLANK
jgi:phage terminase large subunit-like protein